MNLSRNIKATIALAYAEGTASRDGATLNMSGWDGVLFIVQHAGIAGSAAGDIHMEQGALSNLNDAADLAGSAIAVADDDDNQIFCIDLYKPSDQYVRGVVTKNGANNQAESAIYIQYRGRKLPISKAGFNEHELHVSPAEGTK